MYAQVPIHCRSLKLRRNQLTRIAGKLGTKRMSFPQVSKNLSQVWDFKLMRLNLNLEQENKQKKFISQY
jgi:hypothetical protein